VSASDAPVRDAGLRTRSGNAMSRTRAAILDAAEACVASCGVRRTTMSEIAATGGVAKATLYNHFRTKDDVLAALVEARVSALAADCAGRPLADALEHAATTLRGSGALHRVAQEEPALLVPLAAPGQGRAADAARTAVAALVPGDAGELVLRWLVSQLLWPVGPGAAAAVARALGPGASPVPEQGRPSGSAGLGWPGGPDRLRTG
jgi:AcrR family transcriptional regulator